MNINMPSSQMSGLIEKMQSSDKDYRYMGVSDLMTALTTNHMMISECGEMGQKMCKQLLIMIEDSNSEVQNVTVKCLGAIQKNISWALADFIIKGCIIVLKGKTNKQAEAYAIAMREMVKYVDSESAQATASMKNEIVPGLLFALAQPRQDCACLETLDLLSDICLRFGVKLAQFHGEIKESLTMLCDDSNSAVRKRATNALGNLLMVCSPEIYDSVVTGIRQGLAGASSAAVTKSKVFALMLAAKANGTLFARQLDNVLVLLLNSLKKTEDDELMECILQTIDAIIAVCPVAIQSYIPQLQEVLLRAVAYDPNYCGDDDENPDESMSSEADDADSDYVYSDDDDGDLSWKVRRFAAKTIQTLITSQRGNGNRFLPALLKEVSPTLIIRFKEREETVLCDVLSAYATFAHCTKELTVGSENRVVMQQMIEEQLPTVFTVLDRLLSKPATTRNACLDLLSELVTLIPSAFGAPRNAFPLALSALNAGLGDKDGNRVQLKQAALRLASDILKSHSEEEVAPHANAFSRQLLIALKDTFIKISSEAVALISDFANFLQLGRDDELIIELFNAVAEKFIANKGDEGMRDYSTAAVGHFLGLFGTELQTQASECLKILVSRASTNNSGNRVALSALVELAKSSSRELLCSAGADLVRLSTAHLSLEARDTKLIAVELFVALLEIPGALKDDASSGVQELIRAILAAIKDSENDLQLSQVGMRSLAGAYKTLPMSCLPLMNATVEVLSNILRLSSVQGNMLDAVVELVRVLVNMPAQKKASFEDLLNSLTAPVYSNAPISRQAAFSIAVVAAEIAAAGENLAKTTALVNKLMEQLKNKNCSDVVHLFCVNALGEIGRRFPAVYEQKKSCGVDDVLKQALESTHDDIRAAAARGLGAIAVGNPNKFVPMIQNDINANPKLQCMLLNSLKEVISCPLSRRHESFDAHILGIWNTLGRFVDSEEGVRLIVGECLGRSALIDPEQLIPQLLIYLQDVRPNARHCALAAFKFVVNSHEEKVNTLLEANLEELLKTIEDKDLGVCRSSLLVFNGLIHHNTTLIRRYLPVVLPKVYEYLKVRTDLIHEVEMGPFKHEVDDGVEIRKVAYEILYTVMEKCPDVMDLGTYVNQLKGNGNKMEADEKPHRLNGILDRCHDIRMLSYMMLNRLVVLFPAEMLRSSSEIIDVLRVQLAEKPKANAVKQELERLAEVKKSAVRLNHNFKKASGADSYPAVRDLWQYISNTDQLKEFGKEVAGELVTA